MAWLRDTEHKPLPVHEPNLCCAIKYPLVLMLIIKFNWWYGKRTNVCGVVEKTYALRSEFSLYVWSANLKKKVTLFILCYDDGFVRSVVILPISAMKQLWILVLYVRQILLYFQWDFKSNSIDDMISCSHIKQSGLWASNFLR